MKMHRNRHQQQAKLLPLDTFLLSRKKMRLRPGLHPGPRWGSLQCSPNPLAGNGGGPPGRGREKEGSGGKGRAIPRTKILATALTVI